MSFGSTKLGKPNKSQLARWDAIREVGCVACRLVNPEWNVYPEVHHLTSGGMTISHDDVVGLCPYHHQGVRPAWCKTLAEALAKLGPSLKLHGKRFREVFGREPELLAIQNRMLESCRGISGPAWVEIGGVLRPRE